MRNLIFLFCALCFLYTNCKQNRELTPRSNEMFESELAQLKSYFEIPGMAVLIEKDGEIIYQDYSGYADIEAKEAIHSETVFPIASLTKIFTGVLIMNLVEEGKLDLNTPISNYISNSDIDENILVKHVLSHTSQGKIGEHFYYSGRFGWLTRVVEKASGMSFKAYMENVILEPLNMTHTFLLEDTEQLKNTGFDVAQPYYMEDGIQKGDIEYGYSSSAGIVSTVKDMAVFSLALDNNTLISQSSKEQMYTPSTSGSPYGYGIFSEDFDGRNMVWGYGQLDTYSSLFLKIPSEQTTIIILANNNLMSDPARLIYGNATSSLFAMSFLKNYIYEMPETPLFETEATLTQSVATTSLFNREKLRAQALAASFMSRFDTSHMETSTRLLEHLFEQYPDIKEYGDLSLLHNLSFLKNVAFYLDLGEFNTFDKQIVELGKQLQAEDADNPYAHVYMGGYYDQKGNSEKARYHFERILGIQNFSRNWYVSEAEQWLNSNK